MDERGTTDGVQPSVSDGRAAVLGRLSEAIAGLDLAHPVRVGIDGFSAAGKSTLADELAEAVRGRGRTCVRIELDDFKRPRSERDAGPAGYYRTAWDLEAIGRHVLIPLGPEGDRRIRIRFFDQQRQLPVTDQEQEVPADAIVIVDGGYLFRPEFRDHWDLGVFVEIGFDLVLARGSARDAAWMESEGAAAERYRTYYIPAERLYDAEAAPRRHADLIVDNRDLAAPVVRAGGRPGRAFLEEILENPLNE